MAATGRAQGPNVWKNASGNRIRNGFSMLVISMLAVGQPLDQELYCKSVLNETHVRQKRCPVKRYGKQEVAECLDRLSQTMLARKQQASIYFIGDSRMRQQFESFVQLVPKDHFTRSNKVIDKVGKTAHLDTDYVSKLFNIRIACQWKPTIDKALVSMLQTWSQSSLDKVPSVIIIGIAVHHMYDFYKCDTPSFERNLTRLQPVLKKLARITDVVWWNQFPTVDNHLNVRWNPNLFGMNSDRLHLYNTIAQRILKDTDVTVWTSGQSFAEQYVRSCRLHPRTQPGRYHNCQDFVHIGYVAIVQASQYLYNHVCNRLLLTGDNASIQRKRKPEDSA